MGKVKTVDFSETIAVSDLKGSRTLAQGRVHTKIQTGFSQKLLFRSESNFV